MSTTTQHTPGPWHIGSGNGEGSIFAENGRMRLETRGTTLYPICHNVSTWNIDEDDANARLIAAAPELLSALETLMQRAVKDAEHYAPDGSEPIWAFIMDASDAIAFATRGAR
jgi:hypothetical protein